MTTGRPRQVLGRDAHVRPPAPDQPGSGKGRSILTREPARLIRPATLLPVMELWFDEMAEDQFLYQPPGDIGEGEKAGAWPKLPGAPWAIGCAWRRAVSSITRSSHPRLGTPSRATSWVGGVPLEQALIGTPVTELDNLVPVGHVVHSFDPCLVCTVYAWKAGEKTSALGGGIAI